MAVGHEVISGKVSDVERTIFLAKSLVLECRACGHRLDVVQTNFETVTEPPICEVVTGGCGRDLRETVWSRIEKESDFREVRKIVFRSGRMKYLFYDEDLTIDLQAGNRIEVQPTRIEQKSGTNSTFWLEVDWVKVE